MLIKIGEPIRALSNIRIFKWVDSIEKTVSFAIKTSKTYHFEKNEIATVIGYTDFISQEMITVPTNEQSFYLLLYNNQIWICMWELENFHRHVRIISCIKNV